MTERIERLEGTVRDLIKRRMKGCNECKISINKKIRNEEELEEHRKWQSDCMDEDIKLYEGLLSRLPDAQGFTFEKIDVSRSRSKEAPQGLDVEKYYCIDHHYFVDGICEYCQLKEQTEPTEVEYVLNAWKVELKEQREGFVAALQSLEDNIPSLEYETHKLIKELIEKYDSKPKCDTCAKWQDNYVPGINMCTSYVQGYYCYEERLSPVRTTDGAEKE